MKTTITMSIDFVGSTDAELRELHAKLSRWRDISRKGKAHEFIQASHEFGKWLNKLYGHKVFSGTMGRSTMEQELIRIIHGVETMLPDSPEEAQKSVLAQFEELPYENQKEVMKGIVRNALHALKTTVFPQ